MIARCAGLLFVLLASAGCTLIESDYDISSDTEIAFPISSGFYTYTDGSGGAEIKQEEGSYRILEGEEVFLLRFLRDPHIPQYFIIQYWQQSDHSYAYGFAKINGDVFTVLLFPDAINGYFSTVRKLVKYEELKERHVAVKVINGKRDTLTVIRESLETSLGQYFSDEPSREMIAKGLEDCAAADPTRSILRCTSTIEADGPQIDPRDIPQFLRGPSALALQSFLVNRGYDPGSVDGIYGAATQNALLSFRADKYPGLSVKEIIARALREADLASAYYNRGIAYAAERDYERAIVDYGQAIGLRPDLADAHANRGNAYITGKGDYERAIADYDQAVRLHPDSAELHRKRGNAYIIGEGDYDRAKPDFAKAAQIEHARDWWEEPEVFAYRKLGASEEGRPAITAAPRAVICGGALNAARDDWDIRSAYVNYVADAKRLNLSIDDCRVAIGLPKLERAAPPAITAAPSPARRAEGDATRVFVTGSFVAGKDKEFIKQIVGLDDALVVFSSEGGSIDVGFQIGKAIRLKGFATLVEDGQMCASACALAWLGGQKRYMGATAKVGFHAAYEMRDSGPYERGYGNALVGAYLTNLGFSQPAIVYMTSPPPQGMNWLTFEQAAELGISVEPWNGVQQERKSVETVPAQRATYSFQGAEGQPGQASDGSTTWAEITKDGRPAIQATLKIPDRDVTVTVTIYKNYDSALPASHLVEVQFFGALSDSPIQRVPALALKQTEQARGQPLAGAVVPVTNELFWIALSKDEEEVTRNIQLLREGSWFDIPIVFSDQTHALITFEKGIPGDKVFETVMESWADNNDSAFTPKNGDYRMLPNGTIVRIR